MTNLYSLFFLVAAVAGVDVSLFESTDYFGRELRLNVGAECTDVSPDFNDITTSVDTHGGCALLFQDYGCGGRSYEMKPGVSGWDNLIEVGFNDVVSSLRACDSVKLYQDADFSGNVEDINLKGDECYDVEFNDQASSINTNGACVRLFQDYGCGGREVEVASNDAFLGNLGFNDEVSSLRKC